MSQLRKPFVVVTDSLLATVMQFMYCVIFLVMITASSRALSSRSRIPPRLPLRAELNQARFHR